MPDSLPAVAVHSDPDTLPVRRRQNAAGGLGNGVVQAGLLHVQRKRAGLQPGHFDEGLHQKVQLMDLSGECGENLRPFFLRQLMPAQNVREHPDICHRGLYLVGDVADQLLNGLPVHFALPLSRLGLVVVLHQLSQRLGELGVLIGAVVLRLPATHQRVQGFADAVGEIGFPPRLTAFPQEGQQQNGQAQTNRRQAQEYGGELQRPQQDQQQGRQNQQKRNPRRAVPAHSCAPVQT